MELHLHSAYIPSWSVQGQLPTAVHSKEVAARTNLSFCKLLVKRAIRCYSQAQNSVYVVYLTTLSVTQSALAEKQTTIIDFSLTPRSR